MFIRLVLHTQVHLKFLTIDKKLTYECTPTFIIMSLPKTHIEKQIGKTTTIYSFRQIHKFRNNYSLDSIKIRNDVLSCGPRPRSESYY